MAGFKQIARATVPGFDYRRIRAELAANMVTHRQFAQACGLSTSVITPALTGTLVPSDNARAKIAAGLRALGLDDSAARS